MKITRQILSLLPLLLPLLLGSSCATKALWTNGNLEAWNEPADDTSLRLFQSANRKDLLVVYDEYSERSGATHTRAFWLNKNEERLEERRAPRFVSAHSAHDLSPVPVFKLLREPSEPPMFYALFTTNQESFALYSGAAEINSYNLPSYNDGRGKLEKAALTPLAVTADATIIGSLLWLEAGLPGVRANE